MDNCKSICINQRLCHKCYNEEYLKLPKEKKKKTHITSSRTAKSKDSWKDLEQAVATSLNNIPSIKDARRSRMSGALWFEKGDVLDEVLHLECKERIGNKAKDGAIKSFTIQREWLEKAKEEAIEVNKVMALPFRFKEDKNIYIVLEHKDIIELVNMYKELRLENDLLRGEKNVNY